jgi:hypothetical protein
VRHSKLSNVAADVHLMLHGMDGLEWVEWIAFSKPLDQREARHQHGQAACCHIAMQTGSECTPLMLRLLRFRYEPHRMTWFYMGWGVIRFVEIRADDSLEQVWRYGPWVLGSFGPLSRQSQAIRPTLQRPFLSLGSRTWFSHVPATILSWPILAFQSPFSLCSQRK